MKRQTKLIILALLLGLVALIGLLHTLTPGYMIFYHDMYRRLSYFPIAIGGILFGVWGGLILAVASCLAYVPHLLLFFVQGPQAYYSELSEIVFYMAAGLIIGLISSRMNRLSERYKKTSEQLSRSYQRLHDQAARLVEAEKQLGESQKLSMLGQVSASLAHEIKNPLASIKGATEILADEVDPDHPKYEFVEIMRTEVSRLNNSVEDVLTYCRGQQHPIGDTTTIELEKVVDRVIRLLDDQCREKKIQVFVKPENGFPQVRVNEAGTTQVLINLVLNALDAVDMNGKIEIDCAQVEKGCRVCVSDDGPGIEKDQREKVFHSFVTGKKGGTGLGLAICLKIIKSFGGHMNIEKSQWGGASVCLFLPLEPELPNGRITNG